VQLAPDNHRSHNQLAICIRHTNTQQAVAHWLKALELQPEVGLPLSNLVGIYWQMGKLDEAIPLAEWRVRLDVKWSPLPNLFIASWLLYLLEETERYEDALRWARWLVRRGAPADVTTLCRIRCLVRRERKEQARQLWAMVTVIPNTDVRYGLSVPCLWTARLYLQRGDAEVGLHWLGRVQEAYPEASRWTAFLADKAWALRRAGDFEAAIAVAQEATRLDPLYVGGWFELAAACEAQGDHARALRAYRRILRLAPHESLIQQAIEGCTSPHPQGQPLPQRERPMWWTV
jgi:Flp pilus assembly protein TadD